MQTATSSRHMRCRRLPLLLAILLFLSACSLRSPADSPDTTPTDAPVTASDATTPGGLLTLPADPNPDEPAPDGGLLTLPPASPDLDPPATETLPPIADFDKTADYTQLVISSYYATGAVAGRALAEASFVELCNPTDVPLSLSGLSLYVSDRGGAFSEYRFYPEDRIPANGYFLIRGRQANGTCDPALTLAHADRTFATLAPSTGDTRLVLAPAGLLLPTDSPLADMPSVFTYVTSHAVDAADAFHYVKSPSADELIRKKAANARADYQTVDLTKASTNVLSQIRPRTTEGDVNTAVYTRLDEVVFSHEGGVYAEGFDLSLTAPEGYTIYFTVNHTDPRKTAPLTYYTPLHISATDSMTWGMLTAGMQGFMGSTYNPVAFTFPGAAVIKAYAVRASDGACTPLTTQTYFVGDLYRRWDADMVSLTLSSDDFIGPKGIYNNIVQGVGSVRERVPAHVEFLSREGERVHAGWCEIAMNGKGSLGMTQKSFRIMLKGTVPGAEDIGENLSTLDYDLFREYATKTPDGERVTHFRHILLRNGGGDMSGSTISRSHIGDAYIQRLDRYLRPDVMAYAPVMVFVNGEFWGLYNARERLDEKYFAIKYAIPEEDLAVVECPYPIFYGWNVDYTEGAENPEEAGYFMELVRFCQQNNMADSQNYQYIADRIDLDGLIDFYCAQIYLCCSDWPGNNIKIWRNTNPDHPEMDTKWHFCIVDTDHGVGLNSTVETDLWGVINDGPVISRIVNHLLKNPSFRERFLARYAWCVEVYFAPDRMEKELDTLVDRILPLMPYQLDRWKCTDGSRTDWDTWYSYIEIIRDFANRRPAYAKAQFLRWAGIGDAEYNRLLVLSIELWGETVERV